MTQQDLTALITDNLDIWSSAIQSKSRTGRGSNKTYELYGIKKLRALILDLAVRGMLVPQDPNDEPASVLLEKINIEKESLLKSKKIKKPKKLLPVSEDEKFINIPKSWEFVRLNDLGEWGAGATPSRRNPEFFGGLIPWFKSGELNNDYISKSEEHVTDLALKKTSLRYNKIGDVLFAMYGATIGKTSILKVRATTNQAVCACTPFNGFKNTYLLTLLKAYKSRFINMGAGGAQPNISREKIIATVIALPPTNEQKRIVAKVDELMVLCDQLEQQTDSSIKSHKLLVENLLNALTQAKDHKTFHEAWQRIAKHFDTLFTTEHSIDQLKQTILQLAVMGKLVPQNPNDEPASELLKKIAKEKEKLIKQGKIKKQKPLPEIKEDEKPFELPDGWEFVRLGNVYDVSSSKRIHVKDYVDNGVPFFRSKEVGELGKGKEVSTKLFISEEQYLQLKNKIGFPSQNDFLLASIGGSIGNNWICDEREFYYKDGNITKIGNHNFANMNYLKFFIDSDLFWDQMKIGVAGSAYNALTIVKLKNMLYSLPPLVEQRRIVIKVDELMDLCQKMKSQITSSKKIQIKITDTLTQLE